MPGTPSRPASPAGPTGRGRRCRRAALTVALVAALLAPWPAARVHAATDEVSLKAAFLLNFLLFVVYPGEPPPTWQICLLGADEMRSAIERLAPSRLHERGVQVRSGVAPGEARSCHLLYVDAAQRHQFAAALDAVRERPVLLVADVPGGAQLGATIALLVREDGRAGFDINLSAARRQGLQLSSQLLRLARRVY